MTRGQIELERRLGMCIEEIRDKVLSLPNDERWRYMEKNKISGGLIHLAPNQYPKKPKDPDWMSENDFTIGRQMNIFDWIGTAPEDPADELIRYYIEKSGYTIENMERKIADEFKSYHGGCWSRVCFDFSAGKAMFSKKIFSGFANRKKPEPGVYVFTREEYKKRVRRILEG